MVKLELQPIFAALNYHRVAYILFGALSAVAHGARLQTADVDLCIATDVENLKHIGEMLRELNAHLLREPQRGLATVNINDWRTLRLDDPSEHHLFDTAYAEIDVLPFPLGSGGWGTTTNYQQLSSSAVSVSAFGLSIPVAAFSDIMVSKLAAGRPQDKAAESELRRLSSLLQQGIQSDYGLEAFALGEGL